MAQKTVIYRDIDGYSVVAWFGDAAPDPRATAAVVNDMLLSLPELVAVNKCKADMAEKALIANDARSTDAEVKEAVDAFNALNASLVALEAAYSAARDACWENNMQYCHPGQGEGFISDADFDTMVDKFNALKEGYRLLLDGTVIADNRGKTYWTKAKGTWMPTIVTTLGQSIPASGLLEIDLNDLQKDEIWTQSEAARISALSDADKLAEAVAAQKSAKAAVVQVQMEVNAGISTAEDLTAAQTAYVSTLAAINAKYGISLK